jgi:outer membrane biogenesis lipoprotein LolB
VNIGLRGRAALALAGVLMLLSACSATMLRQTPANIDSAFTPYFSLSGRISVRVNDKIDSGQIRWSRSEKEERVGIFSPLGSQLGELLSEAGAGTVTLQQGKEITHAVSVEALTDSLLGVPLDLARLAQWVQGVGLTENVAAPMTMRNGNLWQVTAERFQASGRHHFAARLVAISGDTVVRLVVDEWAAQ